MRIEMKDLGPSLFGEVLVDVDSFDEKLIPKNDKMGEGFCTLWIGVKGIKLNC